MLNGDGFSHPQHQQQQRKKQSQNNKNKNNNKNRIENKNCEPSNIYYKTERQEGGREGRVGIASAAGGGGGGRGGGEEGSSHLTLLSSCGSGTSWQLPEGGECGGSVAKENRAAADFERKATEEERRKCSSCCCGGSGFRYVILFLTMLCLTSICSNMIAFNFTLILMRRPNLANQSFVANSSKLGIETSKAEPPPISLNATHVVPATVPYTQQEKARLLYAVGLASIISTFPFSMLYTKFGARFVFLSAGVLSALSTALLPLAASKGMFAFVAVRVIQGIAYGANFSAIGFVCHRWASLRQHGFFLACMTTFTSLSVTLTNPVAAFISSIPELGWPWVYYVHALVAPILFGLWFLLYTDHPSSHRFVGRRERDLILSGKTAEEIELHGFMPYRAILSNKIVLVVWLNSFADIVTAVFLITYLPTYVSKVLGYGVRETGIWSAVPALLHIPVKIGSGWLADTMTCMGEVSRMRMFNSIALVGSGIAFALVGFVPDDAPFLAVVLMSVNFALVSTNCGGFYKCATLISRQYAHFVVAGIQFEKSITLFVSPIIFLFFIRDESSREQWRNVFLGMAFVLAVANTFFWFMVTDQPAEFTKIVGKKKTEERRTNPSLDDENRPGIVWPGRV